MANFRVHVLGAAIPSALAAGLAIAGGLVTPLVGGVCFGLGVLGGMLPDIDAESSVPTRILFGALVVGAAAAAALALYDDAAPWLAAAAAVAAFVAVRVGLRGFTAWLCVHRGLVHSLPFAALVGVAVVLVASRAFHLAPTQAWLAGVFLTGGFLVHLALDELSSVDLLGARMKRSFGTALKLGSRRQLLATAVLYAGVIALVAMSPPADPFVRDVTSKRTRAAIAAAFARFP
ncbi:LexA-binding, inner membrane-associated putative hydrolase [Nannocystis exedens]|uniref:LexA-binding, inner membrane-associated putative hydrolase n=1 Tax=Nannocystis exedens TaxID=54 RepID=A0A1I2GLH6_9BACT|nr:metal-dependent hydrolase [Nannocystis exedens]PCC73653.1 metal-dependent hydrolase [Nannocystis exedens]SFF18435.1 LexA-binding, inner membrane-associated putative hydrolase [Nannocystis exedens]